MKNSISQIFNKINSLTFKLLLLGLLLIPFLAEQYFSFQKAENLLIQKSRLITIIEAEKETNFVDIIRFNLNMSKIKSNIQELQEQNKYLYISQYLVNDYQSYTIAIEKLDEDIANFDKKSREYFKFYDENQRIKDMLSLLIQLNNNLIQDIDNLIFTNIYYDSQRFQIFSIAYLSLLALLFLFILWKNTILQKIQNDIKLFSLSTKKSHPIFYTQEMEHLNMKIRRSMKAPNNPNNIDKITGLHNNKGMLQTYMNQKNIKDSDYSAIAIFEIDNFSKTKRAYSQEFTQDIIKKVGYTITLSEYSHDIISRTDYNQFTLIMSRSSKELLFNDVDAIRQNIFDMKAISTNNKKVVITITGSFMIKPKNSPLEEYIEKVKDLLVLAKQKSPNKIYTHKDFI